VCANEQEQVQKTLEEEKAAEEGIFWFFGFLILPFRALSLFLSLSLSFVSLIISLFREKKTRRRASSHYVAHAQRKTRRRTVFWWW
tara:strand:+ start:414 stop:671 length:258 start_codon:yes stop_codon:yes gene_type:complete